MSSRFSGSAPAAVWIVGLYLDSDACQLNFPSPGSSFPAIQFISTDQNESYLSQFDAAGFRVWLQVEPGPASVDSLIDIVLSRYRQHPCVAGFGIDVEWLNAKTNSGGRKLVDSNEVKRWEQRVKSHNAGYTLFLKHYSQSWMPSVYRGDILFVDDSQEFTGGLTQMVNEFKSWGAKYAPNKVAFQFGYPIDSTWWRPYIDPLKTIGDALLSNISNTAALFWVDFTIVKLFPVTDVAGGPSTVPSSYRFAQNFPNPFNPGTAVRFELAGISSVRLSVFDILGREVAVLVNGTMQAGLHSATFDGTGLPSGMYIARLITTEEAAQQPVRTIKMQLIR